jgi:D-alanine-D-alanine ligase
MSSTHGTSHLSQTPGGYSPTLGPIPAEELYRYLPADWWRDLFGALYLQTDGHEICDPAIAAAEVDLITEILGLQVQARPAILDFYCGQGRHALELARRGFSEVDGLDQSGYLIERARATAVAEHLSVRFTLGDVRAAPYASECFECVVILGNSFGYFERSEDDLACLGEVLRILKPGGRLLLDLIDGDYLRTQYEPRSWAWIDARTFLCRERGLTPDGERLVSREIVTRVDKGVIADQFYGVRLYSRAAIQELLLEAGFVDSRKVSDLSSTSTRGDDFGMMTRRFWVIATAPASRD